MKTTDSPYSRKHLLTSRAQSEILTPSKQLIKQWSDDDEEQQLDYVDYHSQEEKQEEEEDLPIVKNSKNISREESVSNKAQESQGPQTSSYSVAERTLNLYKQQQENMMKERKIEGTYQNQQSSVNDPEQQKVMFQFLFTENTRKNSDLVIDATQPEPSFSLQASNSFSKKPESQYISALNTRRNPDILIPGGKFLKGNMYFKKLAGEDLPMDEAKEESAEESEGVKGDDAYEKLKNQTARYFIESNPTIKCRNCLQYGHMARDCTNKKKLPNCILCGKDTHDSFSCDAKTCFKCNKVGHLASMCTERNIVKCNRCNLVGHKEGRCLKIWKGDYSEAQMQFFMCIECGKKGHIKCTKERKSIKIKIDCDVRDDLNEFIEYQKKKYSNEKGRDREMRFSFDYVEEVDEPDSQLQKYTNVLLPDKKRQSESTADSTFGVPRNHQGSDYYCCFCGDRHHETECSRRFNNSSNSKYHEMQQVRNRLNQQASNDSYYQNRDYNNQYDNRNNSTNYHARLASDPRRTGQTDSRNKKRDDSSDSSSHDRKKKVKKSRKKRNYSSSSESSVNDMSEYGEETNQRGKKNAGTKRKHYDYDNSSNDSGSYEDSEELLSSFSKLVDKKTKSVQDFDPQMVEPARRVYYREQQSFNNTNQNQNYYNRNQNKQSYQNQYQKSRSRDRQQSYGNNRQQSGGGYGNNRNNYYGGGNRRY